MNNTFFEKEKFIINLLDGKLKGFNFIPKRKNKLTIKVNSMYDFSFWVLIKLANKYNFKFSLECEDINDIFVIIKLVDKNIYERTN